MFWSQLTDGFTFTMQIDRNCLIFAIFTNKIDGALFHNIFVLIRVVNFFQFDTISPQHLFTTQSLIFFNKNPR